MATPFKVYQNNDGKKVLMASTRYALDAVIVATTYSRSSVVHNGRVVLPNADLSEYRHNPALGANRIAGAIEARRHAVPSNGEV